MSGRRDWSFITRDKMEEYLEQAAVLAKAAAALEIHPFAAALAGVSFIRQALVLMGGDVEWWLQFVRTGDLPQSWPFVPRAPGGSS